MSEGLGRSPGAAWIVIGRRDEDLPLTRIDRPAAINRMDQDDVGISRNRQCMRHTHAAECTAVRELGMVGRTGRMAVGAGYAKRIAEGVEHRLRRAKRPSREDGLQNEYRSRDKRDWHASAMRPELQSPSLRVDSLAWLGA